MTVNRFMRPFSTSSMPRTVSIIGVGQLGAAVAGNLVRNGIKPTLFDLQGEKNVPHEIRESIEGSTWVSSGKEAAEASEVVITALPKPEHVTSAFHAPEGILAANSLRGKVWLEHSTTDFENTLKIKELVETRGMHCVEAPLTGGMQILRAGKMVALVGADPEILDQRGIAELISLSAPRIVRCGEFGHATIIKIFSNILCAAHDVAIGETLCVAKKAGLDMKLVFDAMRISSGNSFCWETEAPRMLRGDYFPDFTAEMMHKDISLGLQLGEKYGVPQRLNQHLANVYEECMEKYDTAENKCGSAIPCKLVEDQSGVTLCEGPGNAKEAFQNWTYTTQIKDGSYQIVHIQDSDNPFRRKPFADDAPNIEPV